MKTKIIKIKGSDMVAVKKYGITMLYASLEDYEKEQLDMVAFSEVMSQEKYRIMTEGIKPTKDII